ncbi:hypothetical protein WICPIJ_004461 [Wickerhamomyces pijperi]|uniref:Derlin n=1 Tax=Wickerhamomyces pijperi TaxID=599730 RepID=A0A9P8TMR4_WICPI|nr:hypothetical protein WICPIJ_004461 [Wickerhamomyces pijperi]
MERIPMNFIPDFPPVTQAWAISSTICSLLVDYQYIDHIDLVYSPQLVFQKHQYWRLITCFLYMGKLDLNLVLNLYNVMTYSKQLEERRGLGSRFSYLWFLTVHCCLLVGYATYCKNHYFLSTVLTDSLMYYYARQNPELRMGVFAGVIEFRAEYYGFYSVFITMFLKFLNEGTEKLLDTSSILDSLTGVILGHLMFYCDEVFSKVHGFSPISAPWEWNWAGLVQRVQSFRRPAANAVRPHQD